MPVTSPWPRRRKSASAISNPSCVSRSRVSRALRHRRKPILMQQQAEAFRGTPADTPAQLVQLGEAEALGMFDDHHRRLRHIDADLHHRRRDQKARAAGGEIRERRLAQLGSCWPWARPTTGPKRLPQHREAVLGGGEVRAPRSPTPADTPSRCAPRDPARGQSPRSPPASRRWDGWWCAPGRARAASR